MSLWDKYKLNALPDEQRAEVIKAITKEEEETKRVKLNREGYHVVRGFIVVSVLLSSIPIGIITNNWIDAWKEVKIKNITPVVCPSPSPCPVATVPKFSIKVVQEEIKDAGLE